jgi:cysteine desulfurase
MSEAAGHAHLDHQSSTPVLPGVLGAMRPFLEGGFGSASSLHRHGLRARDALAKAREQVAAFVNASSPEDIIFTSDGTESANLAVKGVAWANERRGRHLVVSATEHPSVLNSVAFLEERGFSATRVKPDSAGILDPDAVRGALKDGTTLVAVHHANHDIGAIQPVAAIGRLARAAGVPFYVDADASAGWLPLDLEVMGASLLSFSPHRFGGAPGVGVLARRGRVKLASLLHGGAQEGGWRAGAENLPAIVGAGVACELAGRELSARAANAARLQRVLWDGIRAVVPHVKLNGPEPGSHRAPANLNFSVAGTEGDGLVMLLDLQGVSVASGTLCASKELRVSPVLQALGVGHALAQAAIIVSFGPRSTDADVARFLEVFPGVVAKLRAMSPQWDEFMRGARARP